MQAGASFDDDPRGLHSGAVAGNAGQMTPLRPAAVSIHDDGEVPRQALQIEFLDKFRFFAVRVLQKFVFFSFHRPWLKTARHTRNRDVA